MVKVSVIIPVLNGAKYIRECMDSIIRQTLSDIEIILVDAGSTDSTVEILEEYAVQDVRIRILHSDRKSMGYQYNIGIESAKGRYIGFCEADDYIAETMYENLYQIAVNNELDYIRSDFDMFIDKERRIFLNYHIFEGERKSLYRKVIRPSDYPDIIYRDVNHWNGIYKKSFLEKYKVRQNETPGAAFQDTGFVIQTFIAASRAMYVHEDANKYRRDNISSSVYDVKGIINVVQEAEFSDKYLERFNITDGLSAVVFKRFCSLFFGYYGKLPEKDYFTNDIKDAINRFIKIAKKKYNTISYQAIAFESIERSLSLNILLKNLDEFDALRRQIDKIEKDSLYQFYRYVENYPKAIIFGAGEIGTSLCALLQKNDYKGKVYFSDNDRLKWGNYLMGNEIISPDKLVKLDDGKTVFVVAMASHTKIIKDQLLCIGIDEKNICKAPIMIPHNAMEIDINNLLVEEEE